jgi:plasmid maintenance system killer protein
LVGQHKSAAHLREQNRALQQQLWALRAANDQAAIPVIDNNELETLRRDQSELLRLRAEVTALRKAQKAAVLQTASIDQTGASVS